jgi:translation initiation factor 1
MADKKKGGLVWSSDPTPARREPAAPSGSPPPSDQTARIALDRKGRGGKAVTTVSGLVHPEPELTALGKQLKQACGAGGTVKDQVIEVQGDHRDTVEAWLRARGYRVKRVGG